jgi:hypothetical protein
MTQHSVNPASFGVLTIANLFYIFFCGVRQYLLWTVTTDGSIVHRNGQQMSEYESLAEWLVVDSV